MALLDKLKKLFGKKTPPWRTNAGVKPADRAITRNRGRNRSEQREFQALQRRKPAPGRNRLSPALLARRDELAELGPRQVDVAHRTRARAA